VIAAASVVTISITAEALAAIEATLADGRAADRRPDGKGGYFATLPHGVLDRLKALRAPGRELQCREPGEAHLRQSRAQAFPVAIGQRLVRTRRPASGIPPQTLPTIRASRPSRSIPTAFRRRPKAHIEGQGKRVPMCRHIFGHRPDRHREAPRPSLTG
jgi:hypothetical protein